MAIATENALGGVQPVAKTTDMTQSVGVDEAGALYTAPGQVTDDQVNESVSKWLNEHPDATTTVEDGSVTAEKLAENAVTTEKMAGYSSIDDRVEWTLYLDGYNTKSSKLYEDAESAIYMAKLEAGKNYLMQGLPYPSNWNEFAEEASYTDNANPGWYFAYTECPISGIDGAYVTGIIKTVMQKSLSVGYMRSVENGEIYAFSMTQDVYILRASRKPQGGQIIGNVIFIEMKDGFPEFTSDISNQMQIATVYQKNLGNGYGTDKHYAVSAYSSVYAQQDIERQYLAMSRDVPRDRGLYIQFIGDSITYAGSNAGVQNCFRKYVSMNLNAPCNTYCQSGISATTGGGSYDWNGNLSGSAAYDIEMTGYQGLLSKITGEQSISSIVWREYVDIVIIALGTNDHWNGSPLGSAENLEDDTTFYGAVEKTIALAETTYPNAHILWMMPFKNQKWNEENDAGCTMLDYLVALKILCQMHERAFVLDLFDKWYVDYDNENARKKFFLDGVHITGNAHKCVAEDLIEEIRKIVAIRGLRRIRTVNYTSGNDSVYGTLCTGISLSETTLSLTEAGDATLTAILEPANTTQVVSWRSANAAVAKVNGGVVTAVGNGETTITATCGDYSATCTVTVSGIS